MFYIKMRPKNLPRNREDLEIRLVEGLAPDDRCPRPDTLPSWSWFDPIIPIPVTLTALIMIAVVVVLVLRPPVTGPAAVQ